MSVGFIGGGRITFIIQNGLKRKAKMPGHIMVSDIPADVLAHLKKTFNRFTTSLGDNTAPASCDIVFVAIHPPKMTNVLSEIKG